MQDQLITIEEQARHAGDCLEKRQTILTRLQFVPVLDRGEPVLDCSGTFTDAEKAAYTFSMRFNQHTPDAAATLASLLLAAGLPDGRSAVCANRAELVCTPDRQVIAVVGKPLRKATPPLCVLDPAHRGAVLKLLGRAPGQPRDTPPRKRASPDLEVRAQRAEYLGFGIQAMPQAGREVEAGEETFSAATSEDEAWLQFSAAFTIDRTRYAQVPAIFDSTRPDTARQLATFLMAVGLEHMGAPQIRRRVTLLMARDTHSVIVGLLCPLEGLEAPLAFVLDPAYEEAISRFCREHQGETDRPPGNAARRLAEGFHDE